MTIGQKDFNIIMDIALRISKAENISPDIAAAKALKEFEEVYRVGNKFSEVDYAELLFQVTYNIFHTTNKAL